jgi:hypothetical protein
MYYFDVMEALYKNKVRYLLVGGLAVNLHGVPRTTHDIDIIISTDRANVLKAISILKKLGYVPRLPVDPEEMADADKVKDWAENRNLKAFSFCHKEDSYKVIDIDLVHPLDFEKAFKNKAVKETRNVKIYLASIDDLVAMKKASGRPQDMSDIELLKKVKKHMEGGR